MTSNNMPAENNIDYIRALLGIDQDVAIVSVPQLQHPRVGLYIIEGSESNMELHFYLYPQKKAIQILLDERIRVVAIT